MRLDPKFALAWALLSYIDAVGYITVSLQPTVALREEARQAAETALTLQPNLGEAVLPRVNTTTAASRITTLRCITLSKHVSSCPTAAEFRSRSPMSRVGETNGTGARSYFNEAERLDPRNVKLLTQHAISYFYLRRFPEALQKFDQVLNITPDDVDTLATKADIAQAEGDLPRAAALLAPLNPSADLTTPWKHKFTRRSWSAGPQQ